MKNTRTFRVKQIDIETPDTKTFHLQSIDNETVNYQSGQFLTFISMANGH